MTSKSGGGKSRTSRPSHLNKEDADLWSHAARSVEPLRRGKPRIAAAVPDTPTAQTESLRSTPSLSSDPARRARGVPTPGPTPSQTPAPPNPPPLAGIDRRRVRKIATGQHAIDARLDLHGLRQSEAHRRLVRFLQDAHIAGLRMVLVITGKGGSRKTSGGATDPYAREEPGVIRRAVPLWLDEPGLRALVVSFTSAHPRHGGSGALYIHIRRRHRR